MNPNLLDKYDNNALWTAVMDPIIDYNIISLLVKAGADTDRKNKAGRSPVDMARIKEDNQLIEILSSFNKE